jgi:hypothetical protein
LETHAVLLVIAAAISSMPVFLSGEGGVAAKKRRLNDRRLIAIAPSSC